MWLLKTAAGAEPVLTFRILPGNVKTVGRSTRADFNVDAALVSRLHCQLTAGATEITPFQRPPGSARSILNHCRPIGASAQGSGASGETKAASGRFSSIC